ncbi:MAG: hypothetical protein EA384_03865 [Spirochaetaceae bacterium]|nr:MAG: hypothetical protein EA384_03865 [Spirochaetaceae bacterium]
MKRLSAVVLICAAALTAGADDLEEALRLLSQQALSVNIVARITENGQETVWNMEVSRVTIAGRAVVLRLDGSNVVVVVQFTPYRENADELLLVAQGQTWVGGTAGEEVKYRTSFKSMPVTLGESVVFFPLGARVDGIALEDDEYAGFNIELEVQVVPYQTAAE